jgi:hypothetical protein
MIIGAPKSATTYLHVVLRDHPGVFMPRDESPLFEDPFYNDAVRGELAQLFLQAPGNVTLGMKCPTYLPKAECAPRIAAVAPNAKLIVALRHPIDRALADYYHKMRSGRLPIVDPNIGLMKIVSGEWSDPNIVQVLEFGLYAKHLYRYLEFFPMERIHVIVSDSMSSLPPQYAEGLFRFLGLKSVAASQRGSANVGIYNPLALRVISALNRNRYTTLSSGHLVRKDGTVGKVVDLAYGAAVRGVTEVASRTMHNKRPALTSKTRQALHQYFREDIARLADLLKIDLSGWQKDA